MIPQHLITYGILDILLLENEGVNRYLGFNYTDKPGAQIMWLLPIKVVFGSWLVWITLTTIIPQTLLKHSDTHVNVYNSITATMNLDKIQPIRNSTVYYIIGHPDDEVMFFLPSLVEVAKPQYGNTVGLVCFSLGDSIPSLGPVRRSELYRSAQILGISNDNVKVLSFPDSMNVEWDADRITKQLGFIINNRRATLITFDEFGVSGHLNHISLYYGVKKYFDTYKHKQLLTLYTLKSWSWWEKYSFTLLTNIEIIVHTVSQFVSRLLLMFKVDLNISFFRQSDTITFYSDLNMLALSYGAMAYGHYSQMVWFRYGWLLMSRYLVSNSLLLVK